MISSYEVLCNGKNLFSKWSHKFYWMVPKIQNAWKWLAINQSVFLCRLIYFIVQDCIYIYIYTTTSTIGMKHLKRKLFHSSFYTLSVLTSSVVRLYRIRCVVYAIVWTKRNAHRILYIYFGKNTLTRTKKIWQLHIKKGYWDRG